MALPLSCISRHGFSGPYPLGIRYLEGQHKCHSVRPRWYQITTGSNHTGLSCWWTFGIQVFF